MFLWLGSYSYAAVTCADWTTKCDNLDLCNCIEERTPNVECFECSPAPDTAKQGCEVLDGLWMSTTEWAGCCDTECQACKAKAWSVVRYDDFTKSMVCSTTSEQALASNLCAGGLYGDGPKWWVIDSLGRCVCPKWTKNINKVCEPCNKKWVCCGIQLNTSIPFIGKCIESASTNVWEGEEISVTGETAFPVLMWSLTKILVTIILIVSFVLIIIWGIMIATGNPSWGKKMIIKVVVGIALLWASGVILRLINPNFFG